ncbi:MAG: DUF2075 domain-containing protein [Proteobacteria bacterium]|nr:DUF2075 domain-containing protein [Pseudomonadota bacterium]
MIVYQATKTDFLHHALRDDIEDVILKNFRSVTGHGVSEAEIRAWRHSLAEMGKVLSDEEIPDTAGVAIEYQLPQSSKRIDFILTGEDADGASKVVIVELKQWSDSRRSEKDGIIWARRGGPSGEREGPHPSYQAWSYAAYLEDFNAAVQDSDIKLQPCAYLHNHPRNGEIDHPHYAAHTAKAPLFMAKERAKLQAFIRQHVKYGDRRNTLYAIENGRIRPSKMLADSVAGLLQGKPEFTLIDDQKVVHETILQVATAAESQKQVVIVKGGPGTGKSVIAVNLLGALLKRGKNARYVSKNAAPRSVYAAKLAGTFTKTRINNLFGGSGGFVDSAADSYDVLIVDEAHRLNEKSGLYQNLGDNQIREVIRSARCTVFFADDDQRVTLLDIGDTESLRIAAQHAGAQVTELELTSQFRCSGSDGYLAWLDDVLAIRPTANPTLDTREYDFRVFDNPQQMHELLEHKNRARNRARVVAGYCWKWVSKKNPDAWDIELGQFNYRRRWNLEKDGSLWMIAPESVSEVGCIHTCQGLEVDYIGVIIGPDLGYVNGQIVTDGSKRATSDKSVRGLRQLLRTDPAKAQMLADRIIKNTYRALMTRGMKGCYVYCTDPALAQFLRSRLITAGKVQNDSPEDLVSPGAGPALTSVIPLNRVSQEQHALGKPSAPLINAATAGALFSQLKVADSDVERVELPDWITPTPDLFIAQVVGDSGDARIPANAWCLFRAVKPAAGSTQGILIAYLGDRANSDDHPYGVRVQHKNSGGSRLGIGDQPSGHAELLVVLKAD